MRTILISLFCLLAWGTSLAQDQKAERIKLIRSEYAKAKAKIEQNGKNGRSPKDLCVVVNDVTDEEAEVYDWTERTYYFEEKNVGNYLAVKQPYFIIEKWESHGHTLYHEMLINPKDSTLMFSYRKGETDGGFVVESRYYYDEKGKLIEEKQSTHNNWSSGDSEMEEAKYFIELFRMITTRDYLTPMEGQNQSSPIKAQPNRIKDIRNAYGQAKDQIVKDDKSDAKRSIHITMHDAGEEWPPQTTNTHIYFDTVGCYFISKHISSMAFDTYNEYLIEPKTSHLLFSYTRSREEGEQREWRNYFDERERCVEIKSDAEEIDYGYSDKQAARDLQLIFKKLTNPED